MATGVNCRFCSEPLDHVFVDLGMSPLSNAFLSAAELGGMEPFYPLTVYVCGRCFLVQLPAVERPENIFRDYAYFSSWSTSWLEHAERYAKEAIARFGLGPSSQVVEVASNDGYLLQYFCEAKIPSLGIEPAANVAAKAIERGIDTVIEFFGVTLAERLVRERGQADLIVGNNVLAHVPDINDFVAGLGILLKPGGAITMEFPHLLRLMADCQYDTIYHEHFSYLSLLAVEAIFGAHEMRVVDVAELPTHGGSLRIFVQHESGAEVTPRVKELREQELRQGLNGLPAYTEFDERVRATKRALLAFLIEAREGGKRVVGYGAPAKGNTLLNYCGIRTDLLDYTVDRSPHKQGRFLPGTHIPVFAPEMIAETRPDYVLVLPWNLKHEILESMSFVREWGGKFVLPIPTVAVVE